MRKAKGWSAMNCVWKSGRAERNPKRAVAAAASLPSSLTSMNDLCSALLSGTSWPPPSAEGSMNRPSWLDVGSNSVSSPRPSSVCRGEIQYT